MVNYLVQLFAPIANTAGISITDLTSYLTRASGYIWALFAAFLLLLLVLLLAHFKKKGHRWYPRCQAVVAFGLVLVLIMNLVCYREFHSELSTMLSGQRTVSEEVAENSDMISQRVAEEGIVLVRNDGLLPLQTEVQALNVFGWASISPVLGGVGSGASDGSQAVGILASLDHAGFAINPELTALYQAYRTERPAITALQEQDWTLPEPPVTEYSEEIRANAQRYSDTALIVIGRSGGEGADLPTDMKAVIDGTWDVSEQASVVPDKYRYTRGVYTNNSPDYDDFEAGEHYLELSRTEEDMVEMVCSLFDKVILVVNANNAMELGWVNTYPQIRAVLLVPGTGNAGMEALGEILRGTVNPSGHTADTYLYDLTAAPTFGNFGAFSYQNTEALQRQIAAADPSYEGALTFVQYREGIYAGYRFWETAAEEGLIDYDTAVLYPFGYGLSYTTFTHQFQGWTETDTSISFQVSVQNTGNVAGKDAVEIYLTPPYTNDGIEKSSVRLVEYGKTQLLNPGEKEVLSYTIAREDLASYDDLGIKIPGGGYVLEAGEYTLSLRSDSHTVLDSHTFQVTEDVLYDSTPRPTDLTAAVNRFDDARGQLEYLSRKDGFANFSAVIAAPDMDAYQMDPETQQTVLSQTVAGYDGTLYNLESDEKPTMNAKNGLSLADLAGKAADDPEWDLLLDQMSVKEMIALVSAGGWHTEEIKNISKSAFYDSDGPAGLNNLITKAQGTAFPVEVMMAQTWNQVLAYEVGQAIGGEFASAGTYGWYAPAMNLHRSAFGGRNFEYFSEDPVLSGAFASEEIRGAQSQGLYTFSKHLVLNEQETNRETILLTFANEQSIRELYLRPFEMAVKEGGSKAMMSSFNWIGTTPAVASSALLVDVLRGEWGFDGMVISDYDGPYGYMITENAVRNGNDLMLSMSAKSPEIKDRSATMLLALREASRHILYTVVNSGNYLDPSAFTDAYGSQVTAGTISADSNQLDRMILTVDAIALGLLLLVEVLLLVNRPGRKRRKL